jgi:hypothetical protein
MTQQSILCPSCGATIRVADPRSRQTILCPRCGAYANPQVAPPPAPTERGNAELKERIRALDWQPGDEKGQSLAAGIRHARAQGVGDAGTVLVMTAWNPENPAGASEQEVSGALHEFAADGKRVILAMKSSLPFSGQDALLQRSDVHYLRFLQPVE